MKGNTMKTLAILFAIALGGPSVAQAQGDAIAGAAKAAPCAACHNADGNSSVELYPKLAGQNASYLLKQLKEFKAAAEGKAGRSNAIMAGMVMPLGEQDMQDLAAYFAGKTITPVAVPDEAVSAGKALYMGGDTVRGIPACMACHGPRGEGLSAAGYPSLSGQHPGYLKTQLEAFRKGERNNDPNGMMRDIAMKLSDEDIRILSSYVAGLH